MVSEISCREYEEICQRTYNLQSYRINYVSVTYSTDP
jgi:hypothetical protein